MAALSVAALGGWSFESENAWTMERFSAAKVEFNQIYGESEAGENIGERWSNNQEQQRRRGDINYRLAGIEDSNPEKHADMLLLRDGGWSFEGDDAWTMERFNRAKTSLTNAHMGDDITTTWYTAQERLLPSIGGINE